MTMKNIVKSYVWIHLWIDAIEFTIMNSYMKSYNKFISGYEFSAVKNIVKSWLN